MPDGRLGDLRQVSARRFRFVICDVFTSRRFGGNQLAVLPDASGLTTEEMQQITREFNFAESAFVFPSKDDCIRQVRIFTPTSEIPFAGHPNIGTAFALASLGELGELPPVLTVTFDEKAGRVPVEIQRQGPSLRCVLTAPEPLSFGKQTSVDIVAKALSLAPTDIVSATHPPLEASVGLSFLFAEVRDSDALGRARVNLDGFDAVREASRSVGVFFYTHCQGEFDVQARMFAPLAGIPEDPATGSGSCALGALLSHLDPNRNGDFTLRVAQGVEMGRPSALFAEAVKRDGMVVTARIGGDSVLVCEGYLQVD